MPDFTLINSRRIELTPCIEKDGVSDIESFVAKWELDEQWLFCIGKFIQITLKSYCCREVTRSRFFIFGLFRSVCSN